MKPIVVGEHQRLVRGGRESGRAPKGVELEPSVYDRLRASDLAHPEHQRVFEWRDGHAATRQWVGVVQVGRCQIEILPKIARHLGMTSSIDELDARQAVRENLVHMLAVAGFVPSRQRDSASLVSRRGPLCESLIGMFAARLLDELARGRQRVYVEREENLRTFRGKLLVSRHELMNAAHRERFLCRYQELSEDTRLNHVLKAACRQSLGASSDSRTRGKLEQCLLLLADVADTAVTSADCAQITLDREHERFRELLRFCALVLARRAPTIATGRDETFSILFDMNRLFEAFVSARVRRLAGDAAVSLQGSGEHLFSNSGRGVMRLKPNIVVTRGALRVVVDTKWKVAPERRSVGSADLYQLYAYSRRLAATHAVLLYPHVDGAAPFDMSIVEATGLLGAERVSVRFLRLDHDLSSVAGRRAVDASIREILDETFGRAPEPGIPALQSHVGDVH